MLYRLLDHRVCGVFLIAMLSYAGESIICAFCQPHKQALNSLSLNIVNVFFIIHWTKIELYYKATYAFFVVSSF